MIRSFRDKRTGSFFSGKRIPQFESFEKIAMRKLQWINAATRLSELAVIPGARLEALIGDRRGQHSIRINEQWRVCFSWRDDGVHDVEIVDYH